MGQQKAKIIGTTVEDLLDPQIKNQKLKSKDTDKKSKITKKTDKIAEDKKAEITEIATEEIKTAAKKTEQKSRGKKRIHQKKSKKYLANKAKLTGIKSKDLTGIIDALKNMVGKTGQTINLTVNISAKKGQEAIRKMVNLPSGAVKEPKITIADEGFLQQLEKGKIDFDILIATPAMMPQLAKYAKILGPKGLMPSPKSGTISEKPEEAKKALLSGSVEIKQDANNIIHLAVGKTDWETEKICANMNAVLKEIPAPRLISAYLSGSQTPSIKI